MLDILEQPLAHSTPSADRAAELLRGFLASRACFTALDLGIFEALDEHPLSAEALAAQLDSHPIATERLCAALCALELLDVIAGRYTNSALASRYLVERSPDYMGGIATLYSLDTYAACQQLDTAVREGPGWPGRSSARLRRRCPAGRRRRSADAGVVAPRRRTAQPCCQPRASQRARRHRRRRAARPPLAGWRAVRYLSAAVSACRRRAMCCKAGVGLCGAASPALHARLCPGADRRRRYPASRAWRCRPDSRESARPDSGLPARC